MKRIYHCYLYSLLLTLSCLTFSSCIREDIQGNSPEANFESLWKIIDEQYCFLNYKHETYGLDWDEVHTRYAKTYFFLHELGVTFRSLVGNGQ